MAEKGEYREVFVTFVRQKTLGRELVNTERGRTREGSDFSAAARAENPLPQKPEYRTRPYEARRQSHFLSQNLVVLKALQDEPFC